MIDEVEIKRDWDKIKHAEISHVLTERFFGPKPGVFEWLRIFAVMLATILVIDRFLPYQVQPRNWIIGIAPVLFVILIELSLKSFRARRLLRAITNAPIRRKNRSVFLSRHGISDFGTPRENELVWDYITEVVPYKNLVLLLLSPVEYIPLQMDGLPDGMARESLLEQIEKWRNPPTLDNPA